MLVKYKCRCMKEEREIVVTDRVSGTDIKEWVDMVVTPSISYDHRVRNCLCFAKSMEFVKIPVNEQTGEAGTAPELHS